MNYAANTGKESHFLEKCISNGKYRTLIMKSNCTEGMGNVIAAVSYQIIPADTQYAEVPLAAVSSNYQNKGVGHLMYKELKERLQSVGISTILCWADKVSEGFWFKQGFNSVGEINRKGKPCKLPVKANIRRALCFPGGSTLMIAYLNRNNMGSANFSEHAKFSFPAKSHAKSYNCLPSKTPIHMKSTEGESAVSLRKDGSYPVLHQAESNKAEHLIKDCFSTDPQKVNASFPVSPPSKILPCRGSSVLCTNENCNRTGVNPETTDNRCNANEKNSSCSQRGKRCMWEASLSSLKSKRIRGSRSTEDRQDNQDCDSDRVKETDTACKGCSKEISRYRPPEEIIPSNPADINLSDTAFVQKGNCPRIMFMNIADDAKKTCLTKIVEELGGFVTSHGSSCTHVITGKARRTLNFCVALSSGAWIVSPNWLKASYKERKFLGETPFILEDEDYLLKYKFELKDAVNRAKLKPHSLFRGYNICLAKHIQPSVDVILSIIKATGGKVIQKLEGIKEPAKTIFLACEEDMEDAMVAAKKGVWTFSSDWFMNCVMKQELDMDAPQFAESL
ncbi:uncharacterized protein LOC109850310 isoform X2 [Asparagus officinalis]|nr:uncharacterized protein LOC109850310 isoform X2 [Asparagus officinalis]